jgi:hypothetical protein
MIRLSAGLTITPLAHRSCATRTDRSPLPTGIGAGSPDARLPPWPLDSHVRSSEDRLLNALREGVARSATVRDLIGGLNGSDVIVYVESRGKMRTGFSAYPSHQIGGRAPSGRGAD